MENFFLDLVLSQWTCSWPGCRLSHKQCNESRVLLLESESQAQPKYQPTWDRVREPLRKAALSTGLWGTHHCAISLRGSVGLPECLGERSWSGRHRRHLWLTWWWCRQQSLSPGVGPSILEQSVSPALPSSHGSGDNGSWGSISAKVRN